MRCRDCASSSTVERIDFVPDHEQARPNGGCAVRPIVRAVRRNTKQLQPTVELKGANGRQDWVAIPIIRPFSQHLHGSLVKQLGSSEFDTSHVHKQNRHIAMRTWNAVKTMARRGDALQYEWHAYLVGSENIVFQPLPDLTPYGSSYTCWGSDYACKRSTPG